MKPSTRLVKHRVSFILPERSTASPTPSRPRAQKYRTNLGAPPSPREIETGLGKEGSAPTNGGGGGSGGRSSSGGGAGGVGTLADTVQEAEDLEALLMGGAGNSGMNGQIFSDVGIDPA